MGTDVDLLALSAELVAVESVSFGEAELVELLAQRLATVGHLELTRVGDNLVARTALGRPNRVVLAGHTDTVPGDMAVRVEGDTLWGLGASDMKGGLAVMLALAESHAAPPVDLTYVFYAREEVAAEHSGLGELVRERPDLLDGDVAILGEPTGGDIEAGCQGQVRVRVRLAGARAHTARPWMGRNAVHRLVGVLGVLDAHEPRRPEIGGCRFHESLQAVRVEGGVAGNVVPPEAILDVAYRFAPDLSGAEALDRLGGMLAPALESGDELELLDLAEAGPPATDHPFVAGMVRRGGLEVRAKLGWTDVARFSQLGVPAVNLGPGDPLLAHTDGEQVQRAALERVHALLDEAIRTGF